jgi:hypothetical protein
VKQIRRIELSNVKIERSSKFVLTHIHLNDNGTNKDNNKTINSNNNTHRVKSQSTLISSSNNTININNNNDSLSPRKHNNKLNKIKKNKQQQSQPNIVIRIDDLFNQLKVKSLSTINSGGINDYTNKNNNSNNYNNNLLIRKIEKGDKISKVENIKKIFTSLLESNNVSIISSKYINKLNIYRTAK